MLNNKVFEFFVAIQDKVFYWFKTSVIWSVINIIFLAVGYNLFLADTTPLDTMILLFLIYTTVMFIPSIQVLFILMRDMYVNDKIPKPVFQKFFQTFADTYRKSFLVGFIYSLMWGLVFINITLITQWHYIALVFFILFSIVLATIVINHLLLNAHYDNTIKQLVVNAIILTFSNPAHTFKIILILAAFFIVSVFVPILFIFVLSMLIYLFIKLFMNLPFNEDNDN